MNWKKTLAKSLIIVMWLWVPLIFWAVFSPPLFMVLANFIQTSETNILWVLVYEYGFILVHLLSIIGLSGYIKEEEIKIPSFGVS